MSTMARADRGRSVPEMTPDPNDLRALQRAVESTKLAELLDSEPVGITLESPKHFVARMAAQDQLEARRKNRRRKLTTAVSAVAAISVAMLVVVVQPWHQNAAVADLPPVLNYEFAKAQDIARAPGKPAGPALLELARAAESQPAPQVTGSVQHTVTDAWFADTDVTSSTSKTVLIPQIIESWTSSDGSTRVTKRRGAPLAADGRGAIPRGPWESTPTFADTTDAAGQLDSRFVEHLPTSIEGVRDALLDRLDCASRVRGNARSDCLYAQINSLPSSYVVPPKRQALLWRMLAQEADFTTLGKVKDRAGRAGVGISFISDASPDLRYVLIASPTTGQLLGYEQILVKSIPGDNVVAPAILNFATFISSDYRRSMGSP
ncbi:MAG: hypothetical protein JWQ70_366 [Aeromicrobium sp.]|nr:hypothetical protein [Aeromicrobium sp.]